MPTAAEILLPTASDALTDAPTAVSVPASVNESAAVEWAELLGERNGFSVFGGAVLFLPTRPVHGIPSVKQANAVASWKRFYDLPPLFVIGLDALGQPIGIQEDGLARLHAESGEIEPLTASLAALALRLQSGKGDLGQSIAARWTESFGPLLARQRLLPRRPRALGGSLAVSNLRTWPTMDALETYGTLAQQLRRMGDDDEASLAWEPGRP